MAAPIKLKSYEFRAEREANWLELESLVARAEKRGVGTLSATEISRLPVLYRSALSSLSVARAISLDRNLLDYLETLTGRAYFCVYGTKRHLREVLREFAAVRFPSVVRQFKWHIALSALTVIFGVVAGLTITAGDPDMFYAFVDPAYAQGRGPAASTAQLREVLYDSGGAITEQLVAFATQLFTHNARIGILAFALGFVAGVPAFLLMFTNGLLLGAFAALYAGRGLGVDFWAWVLPHGVTELGALILCGGAGLILAHSLVFPGRYTRLQNLARRGRDAGVIVVGAVVMLLIAGLIEGVFRQLVHDVSARYAVAALTTAWWAYYFGYVGRRREEPSS
jgi:uncharacterized membrane protein SpoIIM required for sporulation